ncbi:MAG: hypothetical protein CMF69_11530 [Magnetovibrio sp.]|nr:hypothetical protein [Magnetovibrio sp.]
MTTVITNIFNEEYYLPFWLTYHKQIFDNGIVVDYCSTDRSMEIVREICPHWTIRKTRNVTPEGKPYFHSACNDIEAMEIETETPGYKIFLNTTEWLLTTKPLKEILNTKTETCYRLKPITNVAAVTDKVPISLKGNTREFMQRGFGTRIHETYRVGWRFIHNFKNGRYHTGRHFTDHPKEFVKEGGPEMFLVWSAFYPWTEEIIERKLQIKNNIPETERVAGRCYQHFWSRGKMQSEYEKILRESVVPTNKKYLLALEYSKNMLD